MLIKLVGTKFGLCDLKFLRKYVSVTCNFRRIYLLVLRNYSLIRCCFSYSSEYRFRISISSSLIRLDVLTNVDNIRFFTIAIRSLSEVVGTSSQINQKQVRCSLNVCWTVYHLADQYRSEVHQRCRWQYGVRTKWKCTSCNTYLLLA